MMFILCHACGAPQPGPCYPECPITASLVEADRRERREAARFLEKAREDARRRFAHADEAADQLRSFLRRSSRVAGEQGPASRTARWVASTPEAIKRVLDAQKGLAS